MNEQPPKEFTRRRSDKTVLSRSRKRLMQFRGSHHWKQLDVAGAEWCFISCGRGSQCLVFLHGGIGTGESSFHRILEYEATYRILSPTFPPVTTMAQLADGVAAILEGEGVPATHLVGSSFGGMVAQCLVRRHPGIVASLILDRTALPAANRIGRQKSRIRALSVLPYFAIRAVIMRRLLRLVSAQAESREFWRAYADEQLSRFITKRHLLAWEKCMLDYHTNYRFPPGDLTHWPGRVLILEAADDEIISASERQLLRAAYPRAQVHTFRGVGHVSVSLEEHKAVLRDFLMTAPTSGPLHLDASKRC